MWKLIIAEFLAFFPCCRAWRTATILVRWSPIAVRWSGFISAHRLDPKPSFEQALPAAQIADLVRLDLKKKAILKRVYHLDLGQAEIDTEVQRIKSTTRAPDVLAEIEHALGDDPRRFADTVARPIVIERELRTRFENDPKLHATARASAEKQRREVLARSRARNASPCSEK